MPIILSLKTLDDTKKLAETLAENLRCGDVVTVAGDLGAGKTSLARFLIQRLSEKNVEVTSPTFNLLQTYPVRLTDGTACEFYHYDLYRIEHPAAFAELGFEEAVSQLALIEWPERLGGYALPVTLALAFTLADDGSRTVRIDADPARLKELQ